MRSIDAQLVCARVGLVGAVLVSADHRVEHVEQMCVLCVRAKRRTTSAPSIMCYEHDTAIVLMEVTVNVAIPPIVSPPVPLTVTLWPTCLARSTEVLDSPSAGAIASFIIESFAIESFAIESLAIGFFIAPSAIAWASV